MTGYHAVVCDAFRDESFIIRFVCVWEGGGGRMHLEGGMGVGIFW